jgi:HK97 family phage major capsid protein
MAYYPMAGGTNKPPRMGTRPAFGSIAMSAAFTEKSPTVTFAALEPHKIGGIVRMPREIDDQSIVAMGHFLARYGAVEFARAEDTWAFLADGSGTYESVKGICQICVDNAQTVQLASTKTHPSDAVLTDFRNLRNKVNTACLTNGKYYIHRSWEPQLRAFRTAADPTVFDYRADGTAMLDGFEIFWAEVMPVYTTSAIVSANIAVFGSLDFWWFGERHSPRIDQSEHVYFANDQLAVRFIEEIDFDYMSLQAAAVLLTAAS